MAKQHHVKIGNVTFGNDLPMVLIAGPCQMESRQHAMDVSGELAELTKKLGIGFIYKTSFDKANRTSASAQRGIGMEKAMPVFEEIRKTYGCPVLTDVHSEQQATEAGQVVDVLQIPAFLCRQTDLLIAAAKTGKAVNVKKGQFLAPWDMKNVAEKITGAGNDKVLLTERGASFGYNTLVTDMRSFPIMAETGFPVIFDATHSVQQPGGMGTASGGQRHMVPYLARGAAAVGIAGVFMETHPDPDNAPSDGPCMVKLPDMKNILEQIIAIDKLVKKAA